MTRNDLDYIDVEPQEFYEDYVYPECYGAPEDYVVPENYDEDVEEEDLQF